jgi:hypothetical protein
VKLEMAGHPDNQLRDQQYDIHDRTSKSWNQTFYHKSF